MIPREPRISNPVHLKGLEPHDVYLIPLRSSFVATRALVWCDRCRRELGEFPLNEEAALVADAFFANAERVIRGHVEPVTLRELTDLGWFDAEASA